MTRFVFLSAVALLALLTAPAEPVLIAQTPSTSSTSSPHAYFDSLVGRPEHWKSYSLRNQAQLDQFKMHNREPLSVTFNPGGDPDPRRQDAAKLVVPEFLSSPYATLAQPLGATDSSVVLTLADSGAMTGGRAIRVDSEILTVVRQSGVPISNNTVQVLRGQGGTKATSHPAGSPVYLSTNTVPNSIRLPLGTQDGHSYLITWDAWFGAETRWDNTGIDTWKTWQFLVPRQPGMNPAIWLETRTRFSLAPSNIGLVDARGYAAPNTPFGPNVTADAPLGPMVGSFTVRPQVWTRYWWLLEQNTDGSGYTRASLWMADETSGPIQLIDRSQLTVLDSIYSLWLEFNTSTNDLAAGRGPLTVYTRNYVALRDVKDPTSLFQRPNTSGALPPAPPSNVRIVR